MVPDSLHLRQKLNNSIDSKNFHILHYEDFIITTYTAFSDHISDIFFPLFWNNRDKP